MKIKLSWYQNKNGSIWAYNFIDYLIIEFKTIIALAQMTYIVETNCMSYIKWMNKCSMISINDK